jgi:hypothetical protein
MLNLKAAKVQTKKYVREVTGVRRRQDFALKYRSYWSNQGSQKAEEAGEDFAPSLKHEFRLSRDWFDKLGLADHSMAHLEFPDESGESIGAVAIAILPEGDPLATFFVQKTRKDGTKLDKNPNFAGSFLEAALAEAGLVIAPAEEGDEVINEENIGVNQKLTFEYVADVKSIDEDSEDYMEEVKKGIPVYEIVADETDYESELLEEDEVVED